MHHMNIKRSATGHRMHPTVQQNEILKHNLIELDMNIILIRCEEFNIAYSVIYKKSLFLKTRNHLKIRGQLEIRGQLKIWD